MRIANILTMLAAHWQMTKARRELTALSACELGDMGLTELDVSRPFEPCLAEEFRARAGACRAANSSTFKPPPQSFTVITSLESLA